MEAEEGMKLFAKEGEAEFDVEAATAFKEKTDQQIAALEEEAKALTGKDNKKMRQEKDNLKVSKEYVDACKVVKGLAPPNGNFIKSAAPAAAPEAKPAAPVEAEAAEPAAEKAAPEKENKKPAKKVESAGISKAERDELEKLKTQIIEKKY